jgi:hypothetical protein
VLTSIGQPFQGPNQTSCTLNQKQPRTNQQVLLRLMHNAAPVMLHTFLCAASACARHLLCLQHQIRSSCVALHQALCLKREAGVEMHMGCSACQNGTACSQHLKHTSGPSARHSGSLQPAVADERCTKTIHTHQLWC